MEKEIISKINTLFSDGGYKITGGHFEIGRKLHSENYYFIRNFFQDTQNCIRLAALLAKKLEKIQTDSKTTLVGFGNYAAMMLSAFCESNDKYNYAILESEANTYAFQLEPELKEHIVIVLPVTCSGATYFKLKKYIESYLLEHGQKDKNIKKDFLNVFTIIDKELATFLKDDLQDIAKLPTQDKVQLYHSMGWKSASKDEINFELGQVKAYSLILLESILHLPEKCESCFPDISGKMPVDEKFLFSTNANFGTPNLIFNQPRFSFSKTEQFEFNKVMGFGGSRGNPHLFGNIRVSNNSYQNFVQGNIFYNNNKESILDFFSERLSKRLDDVDEVVFVSHDTKYNSLFLEDISRSDALKEKKVTILRYKPSYEFVDNFITLYSRIFNQNTKIIYFEDVLSGAWTFKITSDYIKYAKQDKSKNTGFDMVLTLVDRTSNFTEDEILRKLSKGVANHDDIISYFKLNVPIFINVLEDPLQEKYNMLHQLIKECHLDSLRMIVARDIQKNRPKKLKEIIKDSSAKQQGLYIPLTNADSDVLLFYSKFFNEEILDYVRLYLVHEINFELSLKVDAREADLITQLFNELKNPLDMLLMSHEQSDYGHLRQIDFEQKLLRNIIVSILTKPPFIYYEEVYRATFNYCIKDLEKIEKKSTRSGNRISVDEFIKLKNAVKRSIDVNSNYIISERFLENLKRDYQQEQVQHYSHRYRERYLEIKSDNKALDRILKNNIRYKYKELVSYNYFLLYSFKKLLYKNPGRSIRLEELLNSQKLSPNPPETELNGKEGLVRLWQSSYHLFHRIIKAENISILKDLKELHLQQKKRDNIGLDIYKEKAKTSKLRRYYFEDRRNDIIINNARNFIGKSQTRDAINAQEIKDSVCSMLRLMNVLKREDKSQIADNNQTTPGQSKLNHDARKILDEVINIFQPGEKRGNLNYAFFIEYKEPNELTYNLYPILSLDASLNEDHLSIKLDKNGLIYQSLYGLVDTFDSTNPQTLLFAGKFADGSVYSFQDEYFSDNNYVSSTRKRGVDYLNATNYELDNAKLKFSEMYNRDCYNDETQTGLRILKKSNMTLVFRLSNLDKPNSVHLGAKLKGQAVLVVTNTDETTLENYLNFMNIEKIRLLLLIKEDLLAYLQKLFDNDAFIEILENKKKELYQKKLEHGINRYLEAQHRLFNQVLTSKKTEDNERNKVLFNIIKRAIKAQIKFKENIEHGNDDNVGAKPVLVSEILDIMRYIFESGDLGNDPIPFVSVTCEGFSEIKEIEMHESVLYIVIPEIIINMKKYSSRLVQNGLEVIFSKQDNKIIFKNDVVAAKRGKNGNKSGGGVEMYKKVMETLKYEEFLCVIDNENNIYKAILNLNQKKNGNSDISSRR